jgi:hypothetical protein
VPRQLDEPLLPDPEDDEPPLPEPEEDEPPLPEPEEDEPPLPEPEDAAPLLPELDVPPLELDAVRRRAVPPDVLRVVPLAALLREVLAPEDLPAPLAPEDLAADERDAVDFADDDLAREPDDFAALDRDVDALLAVLRALVDRRAGALRAGATDSAAGADV